MEKPTQKQITDKNVKTVEIEKKKHFLVQELLKEFPHLKVDVDNLKDVDGKKYVSIKDIHLKTDFDNKVTQLYNFKP